MDYVRQRIPQTFLLCTAVSLGFASGTAAAQDAGPDPDVRELSPVTILGDETRRDRIAGSAHYIGQERLEEFRYSDVMRVLRDVPGVYIQEEEGFGLRPNIGIRGSGLDRSSRIALLEDGVLIAPAPYAAPSAYYFPTQLRMSAVEVLKGPSAIGVGSRTTGGAINFVSTPIPDENSGKIDFSLGEDGRREVSAHYGDSADQYGWLLETAQLSHDGFKTLEGSAGGDTGYSVKDYLLKARVNTDPSRPDMHALEVKLGYTDQISDETYLGLTDEDFDADPYRRYAGSQLDNINTGHQQQQLTYTYLPRSSAWSANVTAYNNEFDRNWFKLRNVEGTSISNILADPVTFATELDYIRGATSPDDALTLRNNNRAYYSRGIQGQIDFDVNAFAAPMSFTAGFRVHRDEEDRYQDQDDFRMENGLLVLTTDGAPGSTTNRVSEAEVASLFVEGEIELGAWTLNPGLRFEDIDMQRKDFSTDDPTRGMGPTGVRDTELSVLIPGLGVLYDVNDRVQLLAGVHKGFNPPSPGSASQEEESVNYEFGARYRGSVISGEAIAFFTDYSNLVGTVTDSTGGGGTIGDQFDGGEATVSGLELSGGLDAGALADSSVAIPITLTLTHTAEAEFDTGFESNFEPWGDVMAGDELPYVPENQVQLSLGVSGQRWGVSMNTVYVDEIRTRAGQGSIPAADRIDSYTVVDLAARYQINSRLSAFLRVDNLFDEEYAVARRPAGLRPGMPQSAVVGFSLGL